MSKYRYAAKVDRNQPGIVKALRKIPGVTVEVGHDDILVGYKRRTYWFEIKEPGTVSRRTGDVRPSELKPSQKKLIEEWRGFYKIVWNVDQILTEIGVK